MFSLYSLDTNRKTTKTTTHSGITYFKNKTQSWKTIHRLGHIPYGNSNY